MPPTSAHWAGSWAWALPAMYDSMTLVYAKSAFTQPPKSWRELWDPKYAGKVAIATNPAVNGSMIAMTMLANRLAGAPDGGGNFDAGFAYLEKLRPNVGTWNPGPTSTGWWGRTRCCWPLGGTRAARASWIHSRAMHPPCPRKARSRCRS